MKFCTSCGKMLKFDGEDWYYPHANPHDTKRSWIEKGEEKECMKSVPTQRQDHEFSFAGMKTKEWISFSIANQKYQGVEYRKCCEILEECGFKHEKNQKEKWHKDGVPPFKLLEKL